MAEKKENKEPVKTHLDLDVVGIEMTQIQLKRLATLLTGEGAAELFMIFKSVMAQDIDRSIGSIQGADIATYGQANGSYGLAKGLSNLRTAVDEALEDCDTLAQKEKNTLDSTE